MNEVAMLNPEISELTTLFGAIDTSCKAIGNLVKRSQLPSSETLGYQGEVNVEGEDVTADENCLANALQPGTNLVAAAYCLYSSSTFFVLTLGSGTYGFTLDENIGEFVLSHPNVKIPDSHNIISFNEANIEKWDEPMKKVVKGWREGTGASGTRYSSR